MVLELNRRFTGKQRIDLIKNEINSLFSKVNKQGKLLLIRRSCNNLLGLNLLLDLLDYNKKTRISAKQALNHPYFTSPETANKPTSNILTTKNNL